MQPCIVPSYLACCRYMCRFCTAGDEVSIIWWESFRTKDQQSLPCQCMTGVPLSLAPVTPLFQCSFQQRKDQMSFIYLVGPHVFSSINENCHSKLDI